MEGKERRAHPRLEISAIIELHTSTGVSVGDLKDISLGGAALILANTPCEPGEMVSLQLGPDNSKERLEAKVIRVSPHKKGTLIAVQFKTLNDETRRQISDLLSLVSFQR